MYLRHVDMHSSAHLLYTQESYGAFLAPYTLHQIINTSCTCATLHIALRLSLLEFPLVDENFHDNVTMRKGSTPALNEFNEGKYDREWLHIGGFLKTMTPDATWTKE